MDGFVGVQPLPQGEQGLCRCLVLFLQIDLGQPPLQPLVADIVGLALAGHRPEGAGNHPICHKNSGKERQVLPLDGVLEGNAGGGDKDGTHAQSSLSPEAAEHRPGHQVGVSLADPRPGVAQGDGAIQHGLQHPVAQGHLLGPLRHTLGGEQVLENVVDVIVRVLPVFWCKHDNFPNHIGLRFCPHHICGSHP